MEHSNIYNYLYQLIDNKFYNELTDIQDRVDTLYTFNKITTEEYKELNNFLKEKY